jgi:hypothetical protein
MAITGQGIQFYPLFWTFHDQWKFYVPHINGGYSIFNHFGHVHFFMLGFDLSRDSGDAFSGQQTYNFQIQDVWGPRSKDPNQNDLYRVIGKPKWYYQVTELWRRIFVQPWDKSTDLKQGVKYDASPDDKRMGPFREGMANHGLTSYSPYFLAGARSLPIEYFRSQEHVRSIRDNYVADRARALLGSDYDDSKYNLDHDNFLLARYNDAGDTGHHAGVDPFSDELYIWPVLEYQKVVQLDWEILPGSTPDVTDLDDATDRYGDGWETQITVPFVDPVTQKYRSPFANDPGVVLPFGQYNEWASLGNRKLVPTTNRLRHNPHPQYGDNRPYDQRLDLDPAKAGQVITQWHNPWGDQSGGRIVQQCLGGIVQVRARIILEHKLGGRMDTWVTATQYLPSTDFEGSDQKQGTAA